MDFSINYLFQSHNVLLYVLYLYPLLNLCTGGLLEATEHEIYLTSYLITCFGSNSLSNINIHTEIAISRKTSMRVHEISIMNGFFIRYYIFYQPSDVELRPTKKIYKQLNYEVFIVTEHKNTHYLSRDYRRVR